MAAPVYVPASSEHELLFSTPLPADVISGLFDDSHCNRCEVTSHCGFDLHFPDGKWCRPSFHYRKSPTYKPSSCELFQRCDCAFHQCQVWMKLQLAFHHLWLTILQLSHASPPFLHQSVTLHAFSLNASPYMPVVVLPYFSRYCTIRFKMYPLFFVFAF